MAIPINDKMKEQLEALFNRATMKIILGNDDFVAAINQAFAQYPSYLNRFEKKENPTNEGGYDSYAKHPQRLA